MLKEYSAAEKVHVLLRENPCKRYALFEFGIALFPNPSKRWAVASDQIRITRKALDGLREEGLAKKTLDDTRGITLFRYGLNI